MKASPHHLSLKPVCHPKLQLMLTRWEPCPACQPWKRLLLLAMPWRILSLFASTDAECLSFPLCIACSASKASEQPAECTASTEPREGWEAGRQEQPPWVFPRESQKWRLTQAHETEACRWLRETYYPHSEARTKGLGKPRGVESEFGYPALT